MKVIYATPIRIKIGEALTDAFAKGLRVERIILDDAEAAELFDFVSQNETMCGTSLDILKEDFLKTGVNQFMGVIVEREKKS